MARFRFQGLEIWQMAIELGDKLFDKEQNDFLDAFELLSKRITSFKKTLNIEGEEPRAWGVEQGHIAKPMLQALGPQPSAQRLRTLD